MFDLLDKKTEVRKAVKEAGYIPGDFLYNVSYNTCGRRKYHVHIHKTGLEEKERFELEQAVLKKVKNITLHITKE